MFYDTFEPPDLRKPVCEAICLQSSFGSHKTVAYPRDIFGFGKFVKLVINLQRIQKSTNNKLVNVEPGRFDFFKNKSLG